MPSIATGEAALAALVTMQGPTSRSKKAAFPTVVPGAFLRQSQVEEVLRWRAGPCRELPPEEGALWEAAIQIDLLAVDAAKAQVARGETVAAWMAGQKHVAGDRKGHPHKSLDKALLLSLFVFNFLALAALGAAIDWVLRHLG